MTPQSTGPRKDRWWSRLTDLWSAPRGGEVTASPPQPGPTEPRQPPEVPEPPEPRQPPEVPQPPQLPPPPEVTGPTKPPHPPEVTEPPPAQPSHGGNRTATDTAAPAGRPTPSVPPLPPSGPGEKHLTLVARRLIDVRDRLALEARDGPVPAWLDGELVAALADEGVTPIEDDAEVDGMRHFVVAARPTDDHALDEHIAATLRPGYDSRQGLVRPQVVVAWVQEETP